MPPYCLEYRGGLPPSDDEWQMFQRLFLPPRHMRDYVFHRPLARNARFRQLRV